MRYDIAVRAGLIALLAGCGRLGFGDAVAPNDDAVPPADTEAGLVAWLPFDTIADDATPDATGNAHTGRCSTVLGTCPVSEAGRIGMALRFDGRDDQLVLDAPADFATTSGFTVAIWIWIDELPAMGTAGCFANKGLGSGTVDAWQVCLADDGSVGFYSAADTTDGDRSIFTSPGLVTIEAWHHVALRWDGTNETIWFDGAANISGQGGIGFDGSPVTVGEDIDSGSGVAPFGGILDELRIYDHALSAAELVELAAGA
jgi:hypothetical protein